MHFGHNKVNKMFTLLFVNAISSKSQFAFWFKKSQDGRIFGNDYFVNAIDKKLLGGKIIKGEWRWSHFPRFMCRYDFWIDPKKLQMKNPLWKSDSMLDELRKSAQKCWVVLKWVSIDKQTMGSREHMDWHGILVTRGRGVVPVWCSIWGRVHLFFFFHNRLNSLRCHFGHFDWSQIPLLNFSWS